MVHGEANASGSAPACYLQAWLQPDRVNAPPARARRAFPAAGRQGRWVAMASPDGVGDSLAIRQQAWLHGTVVGRGIAVERPLAPGRRHWLHVAAGAVAVAGLGGTHALAAGDALGFAGETGTLSLRGTGDGEADVLWFDLP